MASQKFVAVSALLCLNFVPLNAALANSAPTIDPLGSFSVAAGHEFSLVVKPQDTDNVVPGVRVIDMPQTAIFKDNRNGSRTFIWTPNSNHVGTHRITFEAIDAEDSTLRTQQVLTLNITLDQSSDLNQAPQIQALADIHSQTGVPISFRVVPVDPEGVVPGLQVKGLPEGASFEDNKDGTRQFTWTPLDAQAGDHTVTFVAVDANDHELSNQHDVLVSLTRANQEQGDEEKDDENTFPPSPDTSGIAKPEFIGLEDQTLFLGETLSLRVEPYDSDGSVPGLAVDRLPVGASFQDNRDGTRTFRWQPYPINLGDTWVTFSAIDADNASVRTHQAIKIHVERDPNNPVNFPPVINGIRNPMIRVGDTLNQLVQPVDPDFTVPFLWALNPPTDSSFLDNGDGTRNLVWKTSQNDLGDHEFRFKASDSEDTGLTFESAITVSVVEADTLNRRGERLRVLADARDFHIGFAATLKSDGLADNELYLDLAAEEFNMLTPENSHKMGWVQPFRGEFEFEDADKLADYAQEKGMLLHGHPLVWYAQLPGWVQSLELDEVQSVMEEHVNTLVSRYRGRVKVWDVVNEAINDVDGGLRESIWYKGMGSDYIRQAFLVAKNADPDAVLIYNDYDIAWHNTKSDAMYELLKAELAAGTPIDGVGFQMHLRADFQDFEGVKSNMQRFADLGLDIYITEFDVAMNNANEEALQADVFQRSLELCLDQPRCKAMQSWGFTDRYSWRSNYQPLLFTDRYIAKPAYYAWQSVLREYGLNR